MRTLAIVLSVVASFLAVQSALARDWLVERVSGSAWSVDADRSRTKLEGKRSSDPTFRFSI